jgi:hypothetical protein
MIMVFAVQCPNPRCRKFMLVEEHDCNNVVNCLLCKTPIRVGPPPALDQQPTVSPQRVSSRLTPAPRL